MKEMCTFFLGPIFTSNLIRDVNEFLTFQELPKETKDEPMESEVSSQEAKESDQTESKVKT